VMNADGSGQTAVTSGAFSADPMWSPDGSQIAFRQHAGGNADIYVMNSDGSGVKQLTTHPAHDDNPAWAR
jgi:TolB protein